MDMSDMSPSNVVKMSQTIQGSKMMTKNSKMKPVISKTFPEQESKQKSSKHQAAADKDASTGDTKRRSSSKPIWDQKAGRLYRGSFEMDVADSDSGSSIESKDLKQFELHEWEGRFDYFIAGLSYAVGTANFITFPQRVYANGGGAFLLVYLVVFCLFTIPLLYLETAIGQFSSLGFISVWRVSPLFKGLGYCISLVTLDLAFAVYQSWVVYYIWHATYPVLPWASCDNEWNSEKCYEGEIKKHKEQDQMSSDAILGYPNGLDNATGVNYEDEDVLIQAQFGGNYSRVSSAAEEFFIVKMLKHRHNVEGEADVQESPKLRMSIAICLVIVYLIVYAVVTLGFTKGKRRIVMYAMLGVPFLLLFGILGVGLTLPGAEKGIKEFFTPRWENLKDLGLYEAAVNNAIYDLGLGFGVFIMLPSLNKFNNNIMRNVLLISITDFVVGILGGVTLFCYLGYISEKIEKPVRAVALGDEARNVHSIAGDEQLKEDIIYRLGALVFIGMPEAFASLEGSLPQVLSVSFFMMLFLNGQRNMIFSMDAISKSIILEFPDLRRHKTRVVGSIVFISFLMSLPFLFEGGFVPMYAFKTFWQSTATIIICLLEVFVITWVYGFDRWNKDIWLMVGKPLPRGSVLIFKWLIPPFLLTFIVINISATFSGKGDKSQLSHYAFLTAIPLIPLVMVAIYNINAEEFGRLEQRVRKLLLAPISWAPRKQEDMDRYIDSLTVEELEQREAVIQGMDLKTFKAHATTTQHLTRMSMVDPDVINIIDDLSDTDIQQSGGIGVEQSEGLALA